MNPTHSDYSNYSNWIPIHDVSNMKSEQMIFPNGTLIRSRAVDNSGTAIGLTQTFVPNIASDSLVAALAHRACCSSEHDYCVVCGVEWPCATAKRFL